MLKTSATHRRLVTSQGSIFLGNIRNPRRIRRNVRVRRRNIRSYVPSTLQRIGTTRVTVLPVRRTSRLSVYVQRSLAPSGVSTSTVLLQVAACGSQVMTFEDGDLGCDED